MADKAKKGTKKVNSFTVEELDAKIEEYGKKAPGSKYLKHLMERRSEIK